MTDQEIKTEQLLLLCEAKLFSEQSTYLLGELKNSKHQHHFNQAVKYIDKFIKVVESGIKDEFDKTTVELLITSMNNGIGNLRKELKGGITE